MYVKLAPQVRKATFPNPSETSLEDLIFVQNLPTDHLQGTPFTVDIWYH